MRLGRYELVQRLAIGGMAEIFLARAVGIEGFEKLLVVKSILGQHAADEEFVRMFVDEARLAATLHHPNIVQVFDIGRDRNQHFFSMEYVHGADLREILKVAQPRGGVPLEHAINIALSTAAGLHYAHEKMDRDGRHLGIVHRDVSPSNVLVSFDGGIKVVDFGIAKAASHRAATRTGIIKGKVSCMSPEQCRGETLDRRSDIFAIGILLYELTTGTRPFHGDNEYAVLRQIVDEDAPAPSAYRRDYPPALEAIVLRALRRNRDERYATAQDLQIDLENFARDHNLVISSVELARYMEELFGSNHDPYRPRDGYSLGIRTADNTLAPLAALPHPQAGQSTVAAARGTRASGLGRPGRRARAMRRWILPAVLSVAAFAGGGLFVSRMFPPTNPTAGPRATPSPPSAVRATGELPPGDPHSGEVDAVPAEITDFAHHEVSAPAPSKPKHLRGPPAKKRQRKSSFSAPDLDAPFPH
jgi:serine/threonine protein kinase